MPVPFLAFLNCIPFEVGTSGKIMAPAQVNEFNTVVLTWRFICRERGKYFGEIHMQMKYLIVHIFNVTKFFSD